ncbi:MAG: tetratricopeptide repeat protein [Gammaproteobacteria bacterium]
MNHHNRLIMRMTGAVQVAPGKMRAAALAAVLLAGLAGGGCSSGRAPEPDCDFLRADLRPLLEARWADVLHAAGPAAALKAIRLGIERQLVAHDSWVALGWCELTVEHHAVAAAAFREALGRVRHSVDAATGLGHVALREGDPATAVNWFHKALQGSPRSTDAAEGLALAVDALPDGDPAAVLAQAGAAKALRTRPTDRAMRYAQVAATRKAGGSGEHRQQADAAAGELRYFARAGEDYLEVRQPDGRWQALFVKGVNIGPALPGRYPSEAPRDEGTWTEWLQQVAALGANAIRVYTLQPPAFYRALATHNRAEETRPLWLLQGVWAELPPEHDFDAPAYVRDFQAEIARVIDAVHGDLVFSPLRGHARGVYDADVSPYTLAWIIGREWEPFAVAAFDEMHPDPCSYVGRFVAVRDGNAMECWIGATLEFAAAYEARRFGAGRPLTFANWPTLDPLHHPTEANRTEEDAWRLQHDGIPIPARAEPAWDDDAISVDTTLMTGTPAFAPGVFASYHVYPNFPYFMNLEPSFAEVEDEYGSFRYAGYLRALKAYHGRQPVLIAEFGMSTSRGIAHVQPEGLHHGGQHEPDAMRTTARMTHAIHAEGLAGGVVFAFMDEWFKSTWSTSPFEVPEDQRAFWFNAESAEQSYGLWAARPLAPVSLSGKLDEWRAAQRLASAAENASAEGWLQLRDLRATHDAGYLYVLLETDGQGPVDWTQTAYTVGLDTYAPERGERSLPSPVACPTATGVEFAAVLRGPDESALLVTPPYRPRHPAERGRIDVLASPLAPTGRFAALELLTNRERFTRDGTRIPARSVAPGRLRFGSLDPNAPDFDTRSDVVVGTADGMIELRIPWGLLNFADPSTGRVLHQLEAGPELGTAITEGLRLYACAQDPTDATRASRLPAAGTEPAPFSLNPWTTPGYQLEPKHGIELVVAAFETLPDVIAQQADEREGDTP